MINFQLNLICYIVCTYKTQIKKTHPRTTCFKNLVDLSTTSNHTVETIVSSNNVASGKDLNTERDS